MGPSVTAIGADAVSFGVEREGKKPVIPAAWHTPGLIAIYVR